ncbi:MAG: phage replisome organizer N-terminal domain-containing protein [Bacillus sp. (in: Bacteria)]|nr:phage replisome organizer N-terminal domain-containing protein [Bacillus sp. (in: firmicutes)]
MYDKSKLFWLMLKEDFFDDDAIQWLEDQPNGKEYSLFYLKLCLKSLKNNGILIRQVGTMLIPYDHIKLGELTKTNPDTVIVAMELLIKIGLIQRLESGELYLTQLQNMVGNTTKGALKKQIQRNGRQLSSKCPTYINTNINQDININKEQDNIIYTPDDDTKPVRHKFGQYGRILLTTEQHNALCQEYGLDYITAVINKLDEYVQSNNNKNKYKDFNLVLRKAIRENWFKITMESKKNQDPIVTDLTPEEKKEAEELAKRLLG